MILISDDLNEKNSGAKIHKQYVYNIHYRYYINDLNRTTYLYYLFSKTKISYIIRRDINNGRIYFFFFYSN